MRALIVGCGYVGTALGMELVRQGHTVYGFRRSPGEQPDLRAAGIEPLAGDVRERSDLDKLPGPFDWVVNTVSSSRGGADDYRQVYLDGTRHLLEWLKETPPRRYVYTSSTSVYGQTDGSLVKEDSPTQPSTETGQLLLATEELLLAAARDTKFPAVILRVSGIYGPDRGHLFLQYLKNEARLFDRGTRIINMVHRDDVVGAIITALKNGRPGQVYNVTDDEPVAQVHFFRWLSETLGKWMPPFASAEEEGRRKRGVSHKKVSNRRLRMELGYQLKYPTFRQGYTAEITRLERAGLLSIEPEPR